MTDVPHDRSSLQRGDDIDELVRGLFWARENASGTTLFSEELDLLCAKLDRADTAEANVARLETALAQMQSTLDRLTAERDAVKDDGLEEATK